MLSLRAFITEQIYNGFSTGDEIYQSLFEITNDDDLSSEIEDKAECLMDALCGWCSPDYRLGDGNYGQITTA